MRDAPRGPERLAGRERHLGPGQEQSDLSVEDVEHLVLLVVDVQRRHVALRLEGLGLLRSTRQPGRTTPRTHYELTEEGSAALQEWLGRPSSLPRIQHEALVRVLAADLGRDEDVLESLGSLREDIAAKRELLEAAKERAATLPHRERHLGLVHRLGELLLDAHEQWLDEVEQELTDP